MAQSQEGGSHGPGKDHGVIPGIQYLRGWAAALVVVAHANGIMAEPRYLGASPWPIELMGQFGVALFFCISGFIIAMVSLKGPEAAPATSASRYATRRFLRIVPFMWLCILGYNLLSLAGTGIVEWGPMVRALAVWPVGEMKPNVIWSLRHEFLFYFLFAIAFLAGRRRMWLIVAWALAPLVAIPLWPGVEQHVNRSDLGELYYMALCGSSVGANLQFGVGLFLGLAWLRGARFVRPHLSYGPILCLAAVAAAAVIVEFQQAPFGLARAVTWTLLAGSIAWLSLAIVHPARGWLHRLGLVLGNASFSIYLVHNPALLVQFEIADRIPLSAEIFYFIAVAGAIVAGIVVHYAVEVPLLRMLTRRRRPFVGQEPEPSAGRV